MFTQDTLGGFEERSDFLGYGYLGNSFRTEETDRYLVKAANKLDIAEEDLFEWCNSKYGRWEAENSGLGHVTMKRLLAVLPEQVAALQTETARQATYDI